jgi:thioredoxin 1
MFFCPKGNKTALFTLVLLCLLVVFSGPARGAGNVDGEQIPVKGTVTLVDLGSDSCLPCRMMAPILVALKQEYQGKAAIIFVDVYRENAVARKFHPMVIPTQIFFDRTGKEVSRHEGFLEKGAIVKQLNALLAEKG